VKWLLGYIKGHRFTVFAIYRIASASRCCCSCRPAAEPTPPPRNRAMKPYWALLALGLAACATRAPLMLTTPLPPEAAAEALPRYHWQLADARDARASAWTRCSCAAMHRSPWTSSMAGWPSATCQPHGRQLPGRGGHADREPDCLDPDGLHRQGAGLLDDAVASAWKARCRHGAGEPPRLRLTARKGDVLVFNGTPTAETRYGGAGETVFLEVAAEEVPCPHPLIPDARCLQHARSAFDAQGLETASRGEWQNFYGRSRVTPRAGTATCCA
jgi:MYXO-CTERM domain-containing protein